MHPALSRRRFLQGAGVALALPWLPSLHASGAEQAAASQLGERDGERRDANRSHVAPPRAPSLSSVRLRSGLRGPDLSSACL